MKALAPRLPPGVEGALGRFIANFALLEEHLRAEVCELGRTPAPAGEIVSAELSFRGLVTCIGALMAELFSEPRIEEETRALRASGTQKRVDIVELLAREGKEGNWYKYCASQLAAVEAEMVRKALI